LRIHLSDRPRCDAPSSSRPFDQALIPGIASSGVGDKTNSSQCKQRFDRSRTCAALKQLNRPTPVQSNGKGKLPKFLKTRLLVREYLQQRQPDLLGHFAKIIALNSLDQPEFRTTVRAAVPERWLDRPFILPHEGLMGEQIIQTLHV
jgi:hypothetical protein